MAKSTSKKEKAPKRFWMLKSTYLASSGRSVHMKRLIEPQSAAEEEELTRLCEIKVCEVYNPKAKKAAGDEKGGDEGSDSQDGGNGSEIASNGLVDVPKLGKKTMEKLVAAGVDSPEKLKKALVEKRDELVALAPNENAVAAWEKHFEDEAGDTTDGDSTPGSSRERDDGDDK